MIAAEKRSQHTRMGQAKQLRGDQVPVKLVNEVFFKKESRLVNSHYVSPFRMHGIPQSGVAQCAI
jgi:hypothetical protein